MNAAELGIGALILLSGFLSMAAGIGVLRFPDVLTRLHAATKPQVLGLAVVLLTIVLRVPTWGVLSTVVLVMTFQLLTQPMTAHMLGRAAYADPYLLAEVDNALFGAPQTRPSRLDVLDRFSPYVERQLAGGARLNQMTRHILGLFHGQPRARAFRRHLAENAHLDDAGLEVLEAARRIVAGDGTRQAIAAE